MQVLKDVKSYLWIIKKYVKRYRAKILIGFFLSLLFFLFSLSTPFFTKYLIDTILLKHDPALLTRMLLLMIIVLLLFTFTNLSSNYLLIRVFERINFDIKYDFFVHLQRLPLDFFSYTNTGQIYYRLFVDTNTINSSFSYYLINLFLNLFIIIVIGGVMLFWHTKLALFVFLVFILQIFVIIKFREPLLKYSRSQKEKSSTLSGQVIEHFDRIKLIKSLSNERKDQIKFHKKLHELIIINIRKTLLIRVSSIATRVVNNIWSFGIIWYGGMEVIYNRLTIGSLIAFLLISGMLYPPIIGITDMILNFQNVKVSLRRFMEFYFIKSEIKEEKNTIDFPFIGGKVTFKGISFAYNPNHLILKDVNFELPSRKIIALVGRSGGGKTTICDLLCRFYNPTKGKIFIDKMDINKIKLKSLRSQITLLIQNQFLFSGTVKENINYGLNNASIENVIEASKKANAHQFISELPDGYNTEVGTKGVKLSVGEAQRIALARAFLRNSKIVILDEPTSFIDLESEEKIRESLVKLGKSATVLVVAHRLSTVKIADIIMIVDGGEISDIGDHNALLGRNGIYNKYYSQLFS